MPTNAPLRETGNLPCSHSGTAYEGHLSSQSVVRPFVSSVSRVSVTEIISLVAGRSTGKCISARQAGCRALCRGLCMGRSAQLVIRRTRFAFVCPSSFEHWEQLHCSPVSTRENTRLREAAKLPRSLSGSASKAQLRSRNPSYGLGFRPSLEFQ